jgi:hypothetical protein
MNLKKLGSLLMVSIVVFILIAGCIGNVERNQSPGLTPVSTPASNSSQPVQNETLWIHLDPVGNKSPGDIIFVNGTTNLNVSALILIEVLPAKFNPMSKLMCEECSVKNSGTCTVFVIEGPQKDVHIFNGSVDSSAAPCEKTAWKPQEYTAKAIAVEYPAEDQVNFTLMPSNISANVTYGKSGC